MKHLEQINETYFEHLLFAWRVAFVFFVHGIFPFLWVSKGTDIIQKRTEERNA